MNIYTKERNKKISISHLAEKNPMWKGDKVGKKALHKWIIRRFPKTEFCNECKKFPPIDLANISQEYKRDITDWEWLCRRCHMTKDGRMKNLNQYNKNTAWNKGLKFSGRPTKATIQV